MFLAWISFTLMVCGYFQGIVEKNLSARLLYRDLIPVQLPSRVICLGQSVSIWSSTDISLCHLFFGWDTLSALLDSWEYMKEILLHHSLTRPLRVISWDFFLMAIQWNQKKVLSPTFHSLKLAVFQICSINWIIHILNIFSYSSCC